jgi:hypothetical protein
MCYIHLIRLAYLGQSDLCGLTRHFLLDFRRPVQPDSPPVATSKHISTGAKPGKIHRFFSRLFDFLISDGRAAQMEAAQQRLDARAVSYRTGEKVGGLPQWRVTLQVRHPMADFDGIYSINWASKHPPHIAGIMRHLERRPQDFRFVTFLPTVKKPPKSSTTCA